MDYEKKYKEALEWARKVMHGKVGFVLDEVLEKFPELKESEDEKIRNQIIEHIKWSYEEQECAEEEMHRWISWLERQGEQKPTDKVEPKFHEGDWVVYECGEETATLQITRIVGETYVFSDDSTLGVVDEDTLRMWDIAKDAKDGDVLHCWIDGDEFVLIYKGIKDGYITTYGHLYQKLESFSEEPTTMFCRTIQGHFTPATKEQCDTLEKVMADAGYNFDFEKKELKKVESRQEELTEFEKAVKQVMEEAIECGDTHNLKADADMLLRLEQKPAWSEEDEWNRNEIIADLNEFIEIYKCDNIKPLIEWLKSLKDRYTWKPSDKQMQALSSAGNSFRPFEEGHKVLWSLYNDLYTIWKGKEAFK